MRYALPNYAVCKMVFHIASEFITYLRTPTNFGKITFSCSENHFSKFVLSDYSSEENDLSKDMLNFKIKRHLAWTNCVCFIATLSFFFLSFRKSIVLSANPVNRAENYEIPVHKRLLFRIKV